MKKVLLRFDESTGMVYDAKDLYVGCNIGLTPFEDESNGVGIDTLVKLRNAGFTTEEIIDLKRKELI